MQRDDIAHGHFGDITLDWQRASILHRIEEDGCDLATQDKSAISLVRNVRMSSPMCHSTELVADFLDEPVPTTSPT